MGKVKNNINWFLKTILALIIVGIVFLCSKYLSNYSPLPPITTIIIFLGLLLFIGTAGGVVWKKKDWLYLLSEGLILLLLLTPWCIFDIYNKGQAQCTMTDFVIEYCAIFASAISIIFVVITLALQRKQLKDSNELTIQMRDNQVLEIINEFLSPELTNVRNKSSKLRDSLITSVNPTVVNLTKDDLKYIFERQIKDDECNLAADPKWISIQAKPIFAQYIAFMRLMRFFDMISLYPLSETTANAIHFYYVWWRSFLIEMTNIYKETWNKITVNDRHLSFAPNWVNTTERLDEKLKSFKLPLE